MAPATVPTKPKPAFALLLAVLATVLASAPAAAQDIRQDVLVEQIAGANIYLRAGTEDGIVTNDTLLVVDPATEDALGYFLVVGSSASRSVVSFLEEPFPVTRGTMLLVQVGPTAEGAPPAPRVSPDRPDQEPTGDTGESPTRLTPSVSGRMMLQFNTLGTRTTWTSNEEVSLTRRFSTPAVGLRLNARDLPGGFQFSTNLKAEYRHSSNDIVQPVRSVRAYSASLLKTFSDVPLQIQLGRFYNRYETFSGYWDGFLVRYGNRGLGAGAVVGFEPSRANEGVSTEIPKYTVFVDLERRGDRSAYYSDLSFHHQLLSDARDSQVFVGWSQRLTVGRTRLGSDVLVQRDPDAGGWSFTRIHTNSNLPLKGSVSLLGRFAFDKPQYGLYASELFSYERWQAGTGLRFWNRSVNASLVANLNRFNDEDHSYSVSSRFGVTRTGLLGLGFHGAGTLWLMDDRKVVDLLGGVDRTLGRVQASATYKFYRTENTRTTFVTHSVDAALMFPIADRFYATVTARLQEGSNLSSNSVFVNIWTNF